MSVQHHSGVREVPADVPVWLEGVHGESLPSIITSDSRVIRVIAGPGSGKTLGLKRRVQRLIQGDNVEPEKIFVGTFTRAITEELAHELGEHVVRGITVSTLHSLAYRLLRENVAALQGRSLRLLLNFETPPMLYDVGHTLSDSSSDSDRRALLRQLQANHAQKKELDEAAFNGEVERWLRDHRAILIDEIVPIATRGLEAHDLPAGGFDHVLIDEYQDLTACEQALVELIWSKKGSLVVFGDDDQSIYGFRFNHPGGITDFQNRWEASDLENITIPDNHRSGADIVGAANTMMAESGATKAPMISRFAGAGEVVRVHWPTLDQEIEGLAKYINSQPSKEFLVLVPLRLIGYRLKDAIGADAQTSFSEELLEHRVVQERFTLASLVANPEDRVALRVWLSLRSDSADAPSPRNCAAYASALKSKLSGFALAKAIAAEEVNIEGSGKGNVISRAKSLIENLAAMPEGLEAKVDTLFAPSLADVIDDEKKREWAARDLTTLRDVALGLANAQDDTPNFGDVMNRIRYRIATREPIQESEAPRVRITTLHAAKGLQADSVIIAGLADQMLPGRYESNEEREERRRLLYVGVTRARSELIVSWPRQMLYEDATQNNVRIDPNSVRTVQGSKSVTLSRSSLLPSDFPGPQKPGSIWLQEALQA